MTPPDKPDTSAPKDHEITYFVNGEAEHTSEKELSVGSILQNAGFTPPTDYTLSGENPPQDFDSRYDELVKLHQNERFTARFKGPTPTS